MLNLDLVTKNSFYNKDFSDLSSDAVDFIKLTNFLCFSLINGVVPKEKRKISEVLAVLIDKNDEEVKYIIARKLCYSDVLPHFIVKKLAYDKAKIARKVILHSPKLSNADLIEILEKREEEEIYICVAGRVNIDEKITRLISEKNYSDAILKLLSNSTAKIAVSTYQRIISRYQRNKEIMNLINSRDELSPEAIKEILENVDNPLKKLLISTYRFDQHAKIKFSRTNILNLKDKDVFRSKESQEIKQRIDSLYNKNMLNPLLIMRQLCKGDLFSFIYSLSKITDLPFINLTQIVFVKFDQASFETIYKQAMLPESYFKTINLLIFIIRSELLSENLHYNNFADVVVPKFTLVTSSENIVGAKYLISLIKA